MSCRCYGSDCAKMAEQNSNVLLDMMINLESRETEGCKLKFYKGGFSGRKTRVCQV